ncbi:MAG TPA: efflux RND transporter permease subunit [Perlabentimonas sp.]|nr:efflux RND transporter permease subunit [Perlabentimonas sp.]
MLNKIISYSLSSRLLVLMLGLILLVGGIWVTSTTEVDVFPDLNAPTVVIMTPAPGMAPEEVEKMVTFPIETSVNGATGIRRVRSASSMGLSTVWVEFDWETDIYNARQIVSERLMFVADELPQSANRPMLMPQSSIMGEIMLFALTAEETSPLDLHTIASWTIRPLLLSIGGVAEVSYIGGEEKEYQILANPLKLKHYNVSLNELQNACNQLNINVSGGFIEQYGNKYPIVGQSRTNNLNEIGSTVVKTSNGYPITIADVANVAIGPAPKEGDGSYRAEKAVIVTITKQPNVNTLLLTEKIKEALTEVQTTLPSDVQIHTDIFEQATFIKTSIGNVKKALIEGAFLIVVVLLIFLMNFRTTIISVVAIPISIVTTLIALKWMGLTINTMSLGGMAIAIGSLVDDAIIDVENVYKRLRQNALLPKNKQKPTLQVVYDASVEIRSSIFNATLIIVVAFIPLFFLSGMEGLMLRPLGISFIVSLFASTLVALSLTPVMCSYMLTSKKQLQKYSKVSWVERKLTGAYAKMLSRALRYKKLIIGSAAVLFIASVVVIALLGRSFLPPFNEGSLTINVATKPGVSLEVSNQIGRQAEEILLSVPEVTSVSRRTGRAELSEHTFDVNQSEIDAPYKLLNRSRWDFLSDVRTKLNGIEGIALEVGQPISHRIDAMLSGHKANIAIKVFGYDLNKMYTLATEINEAVKDVEGIADLTVEQQIEIPQLRIEPRRKMLAQYGIKTNELNEFVETAFSGAKVSDVFEADKSFPMVLRFDNEFRNSIESISEAPIDTELEGKIPLGFVTDIVSASGPNTINRENVQRKIAININVANRDQLSVVNDIKGIVASEISLPEGYRVEYGGQFESEAQASKRLLLASILSIAAIFLLLYHELKQPVLSTIVLANLPLALIGGVGAIALSSGVLSIPAIIGFITLFGIATRNGILLISRYEALKTENLSLLDRIIEGSRDRLMPIAMTALTTALALIPLALAGDKPGNEIQSPMAVVILGGLLSSILLNMFVVPAIYMVYEQSKNKKNDDTSHILQE